LTAVGLGVALFVPAVAPLGCGPATNEMLASGVPDAAGERQSESGATELPETASPQQDALASNDASRANPNQGAMAADAAMESAVADGSPNAAGFPLCDGGSIPADRFITQILSYDPGPCAGFGQSHMPGVVEGPPIGGGADQGSADVLSLGTGGSIVVGFTPNGIVDGPGVDFIVFENPFDVGGNPSDPYAEPGQVSVSDDGVHWTAFPCTATSYPYGMCAGWHPVYSNPDNCISPLDPATAGGDPFDLADIGVSSAKYVRIVDETTEACPASGGPTTNGFDLDAIAIVNAASAD